MIHCSASLIFFYHPADSSAGSVGVGTPGELLKLSGRHLGRLQDPVGDLLVRGEVPQAISTVATSGPVVEDCWSVPLLLFISYYRDVNKVCVRSSKNHSWIMLACSGFTHPPEFQLFKVKQR